jgi:opacity protein-like surface antigen
MIRRALPSGARASFLLFVAAAFVSTGVAGDAVAQDDPDADDQTKEQYLEEMAELYRRKGPYIGFGGMVMFPKSGTLSGDVEIENDLSGGFNVRFGLRAASIFALEVMYEQFYGPDVSAPGTTDRGKGYFWSLNTKFYATPGKSWQPYVLVGGGLVSVQPRIANRRSGFGMRFAGGLDIHLTPKIVLDIEAGYNLGLGTQVKNFGYGVASVGLAYRF